MQATERAADAELGAIWDWIGGELADREFLLGDGFAAADAYLWMLVRWSRHQDEPAFVRPNIRVFWDRVAARPSVRRVIEQEELDRVSETGRLNRRGAGWRAATSAATARHRGGWGHLRG